MDKLLLIALAAVLGAGAVLKVQEKQKEAEKQKQANIALNKDLDNEALRSLLKDLLGGYVKRHGAFDEDEIFQKHPDPRHVRVLGVEQGRARVVWDHPLKSVVGDKSKEARELADLLTAINLDLPDHMTKLREETRNLSIKRAELEAQYHDLCAQDPNEKNISSNSLCMHDAGALRRMRRVGKHPAAGRSSDRSSRGAGR